MSINLHEPNQYTKAICELCDRHSISHKLLTHPECRTSSESMTARANANNGQTVIGAKALLIRVSFKQEDEIYLNCVLPSDRQLDSKLLKKYLKANFSGFKSFRFANPQEMAEVTGGLIPGTMPPFVRPVFEQLAHLYVDKSLLAHSQIGFNAATLTRSIAIKVNDYLKVAIPNEIFDFSQPLSK